MNFDGVLDSDDMFVVVDISIVCVCDLDVCLLFEDFNKEYKCVGPHDACTWWASDTSGDRR